MPIITPEAKSATDKMFGEEFVEINLVGDTFDDCAVAAKKIYRENRNDFYSTF